MPNTLEKKLVVSTVIVTAKRVKGGSGMATGNERRRVLLFVGRHGNCGGGA